MIHSAFLIRYAKLYFIFTFSLFALMLFLESIMNPKPFSEMLLPNLQTAFVSGFMYTLVIAFFSRPVQKNLNIGWNSNQMKQIIATLKENKFEIEQKTKGYYIFKPKGKIIDYGPVSLIHKNKKVQITASRIYLRKLSKIIKS